MKCSELNGHSIEPILKTTSCPVQALMSFAVKFLNHVLCSQAVTAMAKVQISGILGGLNSPLLRAFSAPTE